MRLTLLLMVLSLTACIGQARQEDTPSEVEIPEGSFLYRSALELYASLFQAGLSDCESFSISKQALLSAGEAVVAASSGGYRWDDHGLVLPALATGALQAVAARSLDASLAASAIFAVPYGLFSCLLRDEPALSGAEKSLVLHDTVGAAISLLPTLGDGDHDYFEGAVERLLAGALSSIAMPISGSTPEDFERFSRGVLEGAATSVIAATDGEALAGPVDLPALLVDIGRTAMLMLYDVSLVQEQRVAGSRLVSASVAKALMAGATTASAVKQAILLRLIKDAVGTFDEAQLHTMAMPHAATLLMDGVYAELDAAFLEAQTDFLEQMKQAVNDGRTDILESVAPGGAININHWRAAVSSYGPGFEDRFVDTLPACAAHGEQAAHNGVWLFGTQRVSIVNDGACWTLSWPERRLYVATHEGGFARLAVCGEFDEFCEYQRFSLVDPAGQLAPLNATLSIDLVSRSGYIRQVRILSGIISEDPFPVQESSLASQSLEYIDYFFDTDCKYRSNPLGPGLGGLGGISSVVGTLDNGVDNPIDSSISVVLTGFFSGDHCL